MLTDLVTVVPWQWMAVDGSAAVDGYLAVLDLPCRLAAAVACCDLPAAKVWTAAAAPACRFGRCALLPRMEIERTNSRVQVWERCRPVWLLSRLVLASKLMDGRIRIAIAG